MMQQRIPKPESGTQEEMPLIKSINAVKVNNFVVEEVDRHEIAEEEMKMSQATTLINSPPNDPAAIEQPANVFA